MENKIKVLVVEDIEIAQKVAEIVLTGLDCAVDIASNGEEALRLFKNNQYELIFMDIGLPDISGIEITKQIRNIEPDTQRTPIVALTSNSEDSYKAQSLAAGMDDFFMKPLSDEVGKVILKRFIHQKEHC